MWQLAWYHQAITWTHFDVLPVKSICMHMGKFQKSYTSHQSLKEFANYVYEFSFLLPKAKKLVLNMLLGP